MKEEGLGFLDEPSGRAERRVEGTEGTGIMV
jgi:hypothetical protein